MVLIFKGAKENLNPISAGTPARRRAVGLRRRPSRAAAVARVHPHRARAADHDAGPEGQARQARRQGQDPQGRQAEIGLNHVISCV